MQGDKERLVLIIVILCYWTCQNGVKGNTLRDGEAGGNKYSEATSVDEDDKLLEEYTDDTVTHYDDRSGSKTPDLDSDTTTIYKRVQEMPLKIGIQFLTAKFGLSGSIDKARQGGTHIYNGAKDAANTITGFIGDGIDNAKYLLLGSK